MAAADRSLPPAPLIRVGHIAGAHGLRGAIRLRLDDPGSRALEDIRRVFVEQGGTTRELRLTSFAQLNRTTRRLTIEGVADAAAADALKGASLMIAAEDLPAAGPGEFYYYEAVGCDVTLADGTLIGTIAETFSNGAHDIWVVRSGEREILVPVIADVVKAMDFGARRVTIEAVPGLLD